MRTHGGGASPHGVSDVVFGLWPPTFEPSGGGGEGLRGEDRGHRSGRRWTGTDPELRGLRPRDEDRGSGQDPHHESPSPDGVRRSRPRMMSRQGGETGEGAQREPDMDVGGASKTV